MIRVADVPFPQTRLARAATEVAEHYYSPALLNHCLRSYVWASVAGRDNRLRVDAELLYVSALLHDLGLVEAFEHPAMPFEDVAGQVAWVLGAACDWPVDLRSRCAEVMSRHMGDSVDSATDAEAHLLNEATSVDISGSGADALPVSLRREVVDAYPRLSLREEFVACFAREAERKPDSAAARAMRSGLPERMSRNPLESPR